MFVVLIGSLRQFLKRRFELVPVVVTCLTLVLALQDRVIMEGRYRKPLEPFAAREPGVDHRDLPLGETEAAVSVRQAADPEPCPIV